MVVDIRDLWQSVYISGTEGKLRTDAYLEAGSIEIGTVDIDSVSPSGANIWKIQAYPGSAYSIAGASESTVRTIQMISGQTFYLYGYWGTGTADARFRLYFNGSVMSVSRIVWTERNTGVLHNPIAFSGSPGSLVLAVQHGETASQSFDSTIYGTFN